MLCKTVQEEIFAMASAAKTIYLKDYKKSAFQLQKIDLDIELYEDRALITSEMKILKQGDATELRLDGIALELVSIAINSENLESDQFEVNENYLVIKKVPDNFDLKIKNIIKPQENTSLSGLYKSNKMFCTQCEAEGFRRITYYLDRPDVMTTFTTTIHADKTKYPVLLANGNLIKSGTESDNRHFSTWEDPFKKPCYLFAMVAGDLKCVKDQFKTMSGRNVSLEIFVETENLGQISHAMEALKHAMAWDEKAYGREYDLDTYMIVAVNDFNMGAMENKGLNLFNTSCILANKDTATDANFERVESVIGHEYFHNWSGNRVTCRDWFQLSLKEGFTVFREQQFMEYITESAVSRIDNVKLLRSRQFLEDSGPMAHPVRPESYMQINNFYTMTIYEKGAEVIRMLSVLLGADKFREATDLYFSRHDGQAVTTDDFVQAMEDASGIDLSQFRLWYSTPGTPEVIVDTEYKQKSSQYIIKMQQTKEPMHIPVKYGLIDKDGNDMGLNNTVLSLTESKQQFVLENIKSEPVLSVFREFSAPVKIKYNRSEEELTFLMKYDSDDFSRWNASQELYMRVIHALMKTNKMIMPDYLLNAYGHIITSDINNSLKASLLVMPSYNEIINDIEDIDPEKIYKVRNFLAVEFAKAHGKELMDLYQSNHSDNPYVYNAKESAKRTCKNVALALLLEIDYPESLSLAEMQYKNADNMTDKIGVLSSIIHKDVDLRTSLLEDFYSSYENEPLVMNKWFAIQASSELPNTLEVVKNLMQHNKFKITNPNNVYSLIGGFCSGNPRRFHSNDGEGYKMLADIVIKLNKLNPQVGSLMVRYLTHWRKYKMDLQQKMQTELHRIKEENNLSTDILEIVTKSL